MKTNLLKSLRKKIYLGIVDGQPVVILKRDFIERSIYKLKTDITEYRYYSNQISEQQLLRATILTEVRRLRYKYKIYRKL